MTTVTASFAGRTVARIGYGAMQLERLRDRRDEAVAAVARSSWASTTWTPPSSTASASPTT